MAKIVTTEQMRAIEQASDAQGHGYAAMMELAGRAVAERVKQLVIRVTEPQIVVLVGPGNNGGDGLVAARMLLEELDGANVGAFLLKMRDETDPVFVAAREAGVFMADVAGDKGQEYRVLQDLVANADMVIDALFGTSLRLPIRGDAAKVLQVIHSALALRRSESSVPPYATPSDPAEAGLREERCGPLVVAVDCPSGLDCDSGEMDKHVLQADETITFAAAKPGLLTFPGAVYVGRLHVGHIGLPEHLPELDNIPLMLVEAKDVGARLPQRPLDAHKGTFGKVMVVGGSLNYVGSAYLCGSAAYRVGAGLVTVGAPQIIVPTLAGMLPEATWLLLPHDMGVLNEAAVKILCEEIAGYSALLIGPGLGREDVTRDFLLGLLGTPEDTRRPRAIGFVPAGRGENDHAHRADLPPLVLDADALNLLAEVDHWPSLLPPESIVTPHPVEFARLAGLEAADVQANRLAVAQEKAAAWRCVVVLKGAFTVIASPEGQAAVLPFATSALASAGTGDVLAGAITGLRAQGLGAFDAALAGAWLHGMAGARAEMLVGTAASVMAGDVLELLPDAYSLAEQAWL